MAKFREFTLDEKTRKVCMQIRKNPHTPKLNISMFLEHVSASYAVLCPPIAMFKTATLVSCVLVSVSEDT